MLCGFDRVSLVSGRVTADLKCSNPYKALGLVPYTQQTLAVLTRLSGLKTFPFTEGLVTTSLNRASCVHLSMEFFSVVVRTSLATPSQYLALFQRAAIHLWCS